MGITLNGYKKILGWWIKKGKESINFWVEVMQDMINRGLSEVGIFVTDDFPGIGKAIKKLFPLAGHQLCMVHLKRNLRGRLSKDAYRKASKILREIKYVSSYEEGEEKWGELVEIVKRENGRYGERLKRKGEEYILYVEMHDSYFEGMLTSEPTNALDRESDYYVIYSKHK